MTDGALDQGWARLELWTNGGALIASHETRGLCQIGWRAHVAPRWVEQ